MDDNVQSASRLEASPAHTNAWFIVSIAALWILALAVTLVRWARTGRVNPVSLLLLASGLLHAGSMAAQRRKLRLALAAGAGIVAGTTLILLLLRRI